jgi:glycosyltransferase involved in cell wall biosynthesis
MKRRLQYFHDGKSLYDDFFLNFLKNHYDVVFSTFSRSGAERIREGVGVKVKVMEDFPLEMGEHDTIRRLALTPLRVPFFAAEVREVDPDVVLACWATTYGFYAAASRIRPYGLMVWGSDVLIQPRYPPVKAFAIIALKSARRVFLDSDVQAAAAASLGCPRRSIVQFPWMDLSSELNFTASRKAFRERLRAREDDVVVMWNRRHDWVYAPEVYIRAASIVVKEEPHTVFAMAGQGRLTPSVKALVKSLGMEENFRLLGWVEKDLLMQYTAASDIYVTTSISDGTSASLLEAMALGLPVVASSIPGNTQWVKDGANGMTFAKDDSGTLAKALLELIRNRQERRRLGARAKQTVEKGADWQKSSALFLDSLETIQRYR